MSYSSYFQQTSGNYTMIEKAQNDTNSSLDETSSSYTKADLARFKASEKSLITKKTQRNTKAFRSAFQKYPTIIQKNTPISSVQNNLSFKNDSSKNGMERKQPVITTSSIQKDTSISAFQTHPATI